MTAPIKLAVDSALGIATADALDPKIKSLISVVVMAEIHCRYCNRLDSKFAPNWEPQQRDRGSRGPGGPGAPLGRHPSGLQIDSETFKAEFGGD